MDLVFADDARQNSPSRAGMGPLVAIGGIHVPSAVVGYLEKQIDSLCIDFGFPTGEQFKWSPGRGLWMRDNLVSTRREEFFNGALSLIREHGAVAIVVVEDASRATATGAPTAEVDVTRLFLERVHRRLGAVDSEGIVVVDRPSGGRADEDAFLSDCLETLQNGTDYVKPERIALNPLPTPSKFIRLLQVADVVTSCTVATIGGEDCFAPPVFEMIKPILQNDMGRIGGVGLKLHPDFRYANLYHWLLGDAYFYKMGIGYPLPLPGSPYSSGPDCP